MRIYFWVSFKYEEPWLDPGAGTIEGLDPDCWIQKSLSSDVDPDWLYLDLDPDPNPQHLIKTIRIQVNKITKSISNHLLKACDVSENDR